MATTKTDRGFLGALEDEALEYLSEIRTARAYQGSNPEYKQRAKTAISVIGLYVRLRATMANERSNELIAIRMGVDGRKLIGGGTDGGA